MRLIRDGEKGGWSWGRGRLYTYRYTVTTRMIPALRWAAMRAILMFQQEVMDKVTGQCPQTTTFLKRKESRSGIEPRSFAYQPNALPLGHTGSLDWWSVCPLYLLACQGRGTVGDSVLFCLVRGDIFRMLFNSLVFGFCNT